MRVGVLGSVVVDDGESMRAVTAPMERRLLALLAAHRGALRADAIIEQLWPSGAPRSAPKVVQTYVSHLRRVLGARVVTEGGGYALRLGADDALDAACFERAAAEGRLSLLRRDHAAAVEQLGAAVGLWRGSAYADVTSVVAVELESERLEELRRGVIEDWFEARLGAGPDASLVGDLRAFVAQHALRERAWALLMRALFVGGQHGEVMRTFQRARAALGEIGLEPGPELRATQAELLGQGPVLPTRAQPTYVTTSDGVEIACTIEGLGARDIVLCLEWAFHLELLGELASLAVLVERLSALGRLICVQRRDTGQSGRTRVAGLTEPEGCLPDIDAVLRYAGSARATFVGWGHGGQLALAYAARRPERVDSVVAVSGYPRLSSTDDYEAGLPADFLEDFLGVIEEMWGKAVPLVPIFGPVLGIDPTVIAAASRINRLTASPSQAVAMQRDGYRFDIRPLLPHVQCPVLVIGLQESITGVAGSRALASMLPRAEYIELPGWFVPSEEEMAAIADEIDRFVTATAG